MHRFTTATRQHRGTARPALRSWALGGVAAALLGVAIFVLLRELQTLRPADMERAFAGLRPERLLLSLLLTGLSFAALGGYDVIAVRVVVPGRVPLRRAWLAGAVANAISNTLGFHAITGSAVRWRFYRGAGLTAGEIARLVSLSWTALGFGFASVFAIASLVADGAGMAQRLGGLAILAGLGLLAWWLGPGRRVGPVSLPSGAVALSQMLLGALEMAAAMGALYVLMPDDMALSFPAFSTVYVGAVLLGIASHAPGGIGVFEATMLSLAGGHRAGILAALLVYRLIYNFLPFALAASALGVHEATTRLVSSNADSAG